MEKYPPYSITDKMLNYVSDIMKKIGEANYFESLNRFPELRRKTRIRSIHSSLAIENNQLSLFQVEDVINGKPVIGEQKDIQEVKNAYKACIFTCPPHKLVPTLMDNLFDWMNEVRDKINPLILSSIFHYEFVFIHPFSDGNGRTARLWQTAILSHWEKAFTYLPIESMIKKNQEEYYTVIQNCNNAGESTEFIEFMLKMINDTIDELNNSKEMKDKSILLLSENEQKVLECIKRNVIIGTKDIIEQTKIADRTVRRILKNLLIIKLLKVLEILKKHQIKNTNWQSNGRVVAELKMRRILL